MLSYSLPDSVYSVQSVVKKFFRPDMVCPRLRSYFYSGWAFLMPYLFVYLLYYATNWPVNATAVAGQGLEAIGHGPITDYPSPITHKFIPCLLHVYWALHAIHVILAGFALWSWWKQDRILQEEIERTENNTTPLPLFTPVQTNFESTPSVPISENQWLKPSDHRPPVHGLWPITLRLLPWLLLALLFYIPGVYLEWPSDPWEHLRRINEWRILDTVGAHSSWIKSAYFIPYSLLSWCIGLRQLFWLDFYYTGICLLLCWQYYRFSRACGLGERASMVFVIIQALLFGNNIFSFYRYYGISSSIYAQLGAIALTRIVLESASWGTKLECESHSNKSPTPASKSRVSASQTSDSWLLTPDSSLASRPSFWHWQRLLILLSSSLSLFLLTAFNHPQGLGIAALGIIAVIVWRLIEWKRSAIWWLIGGTIIINALFLAFYPRPPIIEAYRVQGWLNAWYGFSILDLSSLSGDRMLQIISAFGLVNVAAALVVLYRNCVIAWLTITPFVVLLLPCFSVPFANVVSKGGEINIITFQRMFFAFPTGFSLVCICRHLVRRMPTKLLTGKKSSSSILPFALTCLGLILLTIISCSPPFYNRTWHSTVTIPNDLRLSAFLSKYDIARVRLNNKQKHKIITIQAGSILSCYTTELIGPSRFRGINMALTDAIPAALHIISCVQKIDLVSSRNRIEPIPSGYTIDSSNLIKDSKASNPTAWITLGENQPNFASGITDLPSVTTALQNPIGAKSHPFTSAMIPIQPLKSYRLEMDVKQLRSTNATAYLAIAWYNSDGKLLESNVAEPEGAGNPYGWNNGTYSYFGLLNQTPQMSWQKFEVLFGFCEDFMIPPHACFIRVGALLNYNANPLAVIQLTNIQLKEATPSLLILAVPDITSTYTPNSLAAKHSNHWIPQQVMIDHGGSLEMINATEIINNINSSRLR